jgi:aspartate carbamoyltransferase
MPEYTTRPKIDGHFEGTNIISIDQFSRADIDHVHEAASAMEAARQHNSVPPLLGGRILRAVMFEDSSRTAGSFMSAAMYLGANALQPNLGSSSMNKGESDLDTVRCFSGQSDVLVVRHKDPDGSFMDEVARRVTKPFQNGGNGAADHPSQTILDLGYMRQRYGRIDGLRVVIAGDVRLNRPAVSLIRGLSLYDDVRVTVAAPQGAGMPDAVLEQVRGRGLDVREVEDLRPELEQPGVVYITRPRTEYGDSERDAQIEQAYRSNGYVINDQSMAMAHPDTDIFHPLPHTFEIADQFHEDPRAQYYEQEDYGVPIRMALLALQLNQSGADAQRAAFRQRQPSLRDIGADALVA